MIEYIGTACFAHALSYRYNLFLTSPYRQSLFRQSSRYRLYLLRISHAPPLWRDHLNPSLNI